MAETKPDYQNIFHWAETQKDGKIPSFATRENDLYEYQAGFGNSFQSEIIPGTIPHGQNSPRVVRFGLYAEQMTGSAFSAPRVANRNAWLYRVRPAVAHQGFVALPDNPLTESCFLPLNPRVHISPTQLALHPTPIPTTPTTFIEGLRTVAGCGEPTLREGVVQHVYVANTSMTSTAFVNSDGDYLFIPEKGSLDIQTEFGYLYVQPGEIAVIQKGIRFRVSLPDGDSRGYLIELFGSSWELPELGPLGANGLANKRDFLVPVARIDDVRKLKGDWEIIYKVGGKYFKSLQGHTPFDVVAWHGNYVPYKYDLTKFVNVGSISVDHIDPSIFCVLTAKSRDPTASLADFLIFSPRWDVASNTYRPPYYHRNSSSELMGLIYGEYGGRSDAFAPGSISFEVGMTPHGVAYPQFKSASASPPPVMKISPGSIAFMCESSRQFTVTEWAMASKQRHEHDPEMWDDLVDNFSGHIEEIERVLGRSL
ncbi:putative homogentisate 1,2-dioxygenase [Peziza echinospora]|nr:putative homogentisate 1,2-dioxygenase [Peziza echinospora]